MQVENKTTDHNRTLRFSGLSGDLMPELVVTLNYQKTTNDPDILYKAITLDNVVIPAILKAVNQDAPQTPPENPCFATQEAATANLRPYCEVYKVTNPHRATLYVVESHSDDAIVAAANEWGITVQTV